MKQPTMTTIEERATQLAYHEVWENGDTELRTYIDEDEKEMYIDILTEQDRIARQQERERCIKAAQDAHCFMCSIYEVCYNLDGGNLGGECKAKEIIRKAIEEGGNHE